MCCHPRTPSSPHRAQTQPWSWPGARAVHTWAEQKYTLSLKHKDIPARRDKPSTSCVDSFSWEGVFQAQGPSCGQEGSKDRARGLLFPTGSVLTKSRDGGALRLSGQRHCEKTSLLISPSLVSVSLSWCHSLPLLSKAPSQQEERRCSGDMLTSRRTTPTKSRG